MRRTNEQARDEIARRYRAHLQARARFRKQLLICCFSFALCVGIVLTFGMLPSDREEPPTVSETTSADVSVGSQSSQAVSEGHSSTEEWAGSVEESEEKPLPPAWGEDPETPGTEDVPAGPSDESDSSDETSDVSKPQDESSDEVSYAENDLMAGIEKLPNIKEEHSPVLTELQIDFAWKLFRASFDQKGESGLLVSPLSAEITLAMAANGADGETLAEMQRALCGKENLERINRFLYTYFKDIGADRHSDAKVTVSNGLWFSETCDVSEQYLQSMLSYFDASAYSTPMDTGTLQEINSWVNAETDGKITELFDTLSSDASAVQVNTYLLELIWQTAPTEQNGVFTSADGTKRDVTMLYSTNDFWYGGETMDVLSRRYDNRYSFIALMPKEGIDVYEFAASFDKEAFLNALFQTNERVNACIPTFSLTDTVDLKDAFCEMGITSAFDSTKASFGNMAEGVFLTDVRQQNTIEVSCNGTAGANATDSVVCVSEEIRTVTFDRPFVYLIFDEQAFLPIYIGILTDIPEKG